MKFFRNLLLKFLIFTFSALLWAQETKKNEERPIVDLISATAVATDKIKVTWKLPKDFSASSLLVFKSTEPFNSKANANSFLIAELSPKTMQYFDTATDFSEYYYAVLAKLPDGSVYKVFLPSINATVKPVAVERPAKTQKKSEEQVLAETPKLYTEGTKRELPLPYIDLIGDFEKKTSVLSEDVMTAGKKLSEGQPLKKQKLPPHYFDEDIISPSGGDDYYLFEILKDYFVKQDYEGSIVELKKFLSINRSETTTNRAAFYLAQSQYFTGNYRSALTMFMYTQDTWPVLCKKWINSTLDFYTVPQVQEE